MLLWLIGCTSAVLPPGERWIALPRTDLTAGAVIGASDLERRSYPADYVPGSAIVDPGLLVGRTVTQRVLAHEPIQPQRVGPAPSGATPDPDYAAPPAGTSVTPAGDTVLVVVSARDLPSGGVIAEEDLYAVQLEPRFLPERVFLSPVDVVGRTIAEPILANELVRAERLAP